MGWKQRGADVGIIGLAAATGLVARTTPASAFPMTGAGELRLTATLDVEDRAAGMSCRLEKSARDEVSDLPQVFLVKVTKTCGNVRVTLKATGEPADGTVYVGTVLVQERRSCATCSFRAMGSATFDVPLTDSRPRYNWNLSTTTSAGKANAYYTVRYAPL